MNLIKYILIITVLIASVLITHSQEQLSAEQAVVKALENNYQMQIAQKRNEITSKNNKWSEAGAFPTVELTAALGNSILDNTNNPLTFTPGLIATNSLTPGINVNWNIFSGMGVRITKQRLDQLEKQSKGNGMLILENTAHDVLLAYYTAVMETQRLETLKELLAYSRRQFEYEESKQSFAQSNKLSVFQLKNQYFTDSLNVIQQRITKENAMRNLLLLMNVEEVEFEQEIFPILTDSLNITLHPIDENSVIQEMKANNQNLKNQIINLELQKTTTNMQRSFLYPVVSLQFGTTPNYGNFRSLQESDLNIQTQQITYFANINVRYSLFNNWKDKRAVEVSKIEEEIAEMNVEELEKQLTVNAINSIKLYKVKNQLVDVSSQNVAYAELAYEIGRERYELGSINSIELTQLQNAYLNAKMDYFNALFQRIEMYLELFKLTGKLQLIY